MIDIDGKLSPVSTHSRPKAAGQTAPVSGYRDKSFNTQPPEGGWDDLYAAWRLIDCFNTQPPEGGWAHLRRMKLRIRCFNTQPPEGGWLNVHHVGAT